MTPMARFLSMFGVICCALFVIASGRTNVRSYQQVQDSIEEIDEDRLVVKGLIFEMSNMLHDKEIAQLTGYASFYRDDNAALDDRLEEHLAWFRETKLTSDESQVLARFASDVAALQDAEQAYGLTEGEAPEPEESEALAARMDVLEADLEELSRIQLQEGRRRVAIGEKAEAHLTFIERVEAGMMVLCVLLLIGLFFLPGPREP